ncbi:MAG: sulfotransferase domain-containing protein [Mesorhizobium sp.]|uniref:sulfotransferase domain-containing protein n=1 Tax=Mesorhizobium sp. TaxID=1871066 RepID=UPI001213AD15|nr:sulfotransferase domain-containing protein [Mesorhizobium sp.]TIL76315.1 MAG: sulfotransferase domain-containing protein [Mesorhizobium sp.]TIL93982.1 MAG: sulfotransferase domain-containing protein [Mesorhizobium sp.]TIM02404.1 MAG: sulfotransferase domain-containing protein [Mesorhizobium sp.]
MFFLKLSQAKAPPLPLVVSFPKSGRTWLRVMLDDLGVEVKYIHDGTDHKLLRPKSSLKENKSRYKKRRTIILVRDPRDTVVSGYFQVQKRHMLPVGSFSDFIRSDNHGIEKIIRFNLNWLAAMPRMRAIRYLQYEDLHRNTAGVLRAVLGFLNLQAEDRRLVEVANNRTFDKMKASESTGDLADRYGKILLPRDVNDPESFKVRKGKIGGYGEYLSEDDVAYCDEQLARFEYWEKLDKSFSKNGLCYSPLNSRTRLALG